MQSNYDAEFSDKHTTIQFVQRSLKGNFLFQPDVKGLMSPYIKRTKRDLCLAV
jgi:hypothetical protein